jgi:L-asparagine transporter-like permease
MRRRSNWDDGSQPGRDSSERESFFACGFDVAPVVLLGGGCCCNAVLAGQPFLPFQLALLFVVTFDRPHRRTASTTSSSIDTNSLLSLSLSQSVVCVCVCGVCLLCVCCVSAVGLLCSVCVWTCIYIYIYICLSIIPSFSTSHRTRIRQSTFPSPESAAAGSTYAYDVRMRHEARTNFSFILAAGYVPL